MLSVTVDRTSLALADLVIGDHPVGGLWVPEDGLSRPDKSWSRTTVTSPFVHGSVTTRARLEHSQINLSVMATAASTAALETLMDTVDDAFSQWVYEVTLTIDGAAKTYTCDAADISWGEVDSGMVKGKLARATLSIPCHPLPGDAGATTGLYVVAPTVPTP